MHLFKQMKILILCFSLIYFPVMPSWAQAGDKTIKTSSDKIETPQSRLSREIKLPEAEKNGHFNFIKKHKWWIIAGVSLLTAGVILSSGSGSDENNNDNGDESDGFGNISAGW